MELEKVTLPLLTASKVPILNSNKQLVASGTDAVKLDYLDNVSSDIQTQLNSKLNLSGSNANQNIVIGGYKVQSTATPTIADDLTRKGYVDSAIAAAGAAYVLKAGDTMTGTLTMGVNKITSSYTPLNNDDLTRKGYVDTQDALKLSLTGGTMTGDILMGVNKVKCTAPPLDDNDLTRKGYVDTNLALKANLAGNQTFTGTNTFNSVLPIALTGLTPSRVLQLSGTGVVQSSSVTTTTLGYLDATSSIQGQLNALSGTFANYLPLAGGTISGNLTVQGTNGVTASDTGVNAGFLGQRYYLSARGDNQDGTGADADGPWYGLGYSGIAGFTGKPCLAGYYGCALRSALGYVVLTEGGVVGIGTTNPSATSLMEVFTTTNGKDVFSARMNNATGGSTMNQRFYFKEQSPGLADRYAYHQARLNANLSTDQRFLCSDINGNDNRILTLAGHTQRVGIKTDAPQGTLGVYEATGTDFVTLHNGTYSNGQWINQRFLFGDVAGTSRSAYIQAALPGSNQTDLLFYTDAGTGAVSERFRVKGNGAHQMFGGLQVYANGTGGPAYVYTENAAAGDAYAVMFLKNNIGGACYWFLNSSTRTVDGGANCCTFRNDTGDLRLQALGAVRGIRVKSTSGYVGIGTDTASALLTVRGSITIQSGENVYEPGCIYTDANWGMLFRAVQVPALAHFRWDRSDGNEMMRLTKDGVLDIKGTAGGEWGRTYMIRNGSLIIGRTDTDYGANWAGGVPGTANLGCFMLECNNTTEAVIHDNGARIVSWMHYDGGNRLFMGRDVGWGVTPVTFMSEVKAQNTLGFALDQQGDCRFYPGTADAYNPTSRANNLLIKSWWGIGFESYDGGVRAAIDTRTGSAYYGGAVGIGTTAQTAAFNIWSSTRDYTNTMLIQSQWPSIVFDNTSLVTGGRKYSLLVGGPGAGVGVGGFGIYDFAANVYVFGVRSTGQVSLGPYQAHTHVGVMGGVTNGNITTTAAWPTDANGILITDAGANQNANSSGLYLGHQAFYSAINSLAPSVAWRDLYILSKDEYHLSGGVLNVGLFAGLSGWVTLSDEREKEDIQPLKTDKSLQRVLALKPYHYRRIYRDSDTPVSEEVKQRRHVGFLAQEVQISNPHCVASLVDKDHVTEEDDGQRLGISYGDYTVHLVGAVQELHATITSQAQSRLAEEASLRKQIDNLVERNKVLEAWAREAEKREKKMEQDILKLASLIQQLIPK